MDSTIEPNVWETFVRRPSDLEEDTEIPLILRNLNPGPRKYAMRHVIGIVSRNPEKLANMDKLLVRTRVGAQLPDTLGIKILSDLPVELPGLPYHDCFAALRAAAEKHTTRKHRGGD